MIEPITSPTFNRLLTPNGSLSSNSSNGDSLCLEMNNLMHDYEIISRISELASSLRGNYPVSVPVPVANPQTIVGCAGWKFLLDILIIAYCLFTNRSSSSLDDENFVRIRIFNEERDLYDCYGEKMRENVTTEKKKHLISVKLNERISCSDFS